MFQKITVGKIDAMKSAKFLRGNGFISDAVIVMFDEMCLQKYEKCCGGEMFGADENWNCMEG